MERETFRSSCTPLRIEWGGAMRAGRSVLLWVGGVSSGAYWLLGAILPNQPFLEMIRVVQATVATAALVALSRGIWDALTRDDPDRADALLIGTGLTQTAFATMGFWLLLYRLAYAGDINWMLNTLIFGFVTAWMPALSSVLLLAVPGVIRRGPGGEEIPPPTLIGVGCVTGLGVLGVLVVLATQPNARALVEAMRPWLY